MGQNAGCKMTYTPKKLSVLCIFAFHKEMFLGGMHIRFAWKGIKLQPALCPSRLEVHVGFSGD